MPVDPLQEALDKINSGTSVDEIDWEQVYAKIGLQNVLNNRQHVDDMRNVDAEAALAGYDPRIIGIARLLNAYPHFIGPTEEWVSKLAEIELASHEQPASSPPSGNEPPPPAESDLERAARAKLDELTARASSTLNR